MVVVDPTGQHCFHFIRISMVGLGISRAVGLVIDGVILMGAYVAIGFFGLFL